MSDRPVLRRDPHQAKVAGVCSALAQWWNVDPVIVRVGFVAVAILTNGLGLLAYLALWALIPSAGSQTEPVRQLFPFTRSWSGAVLVTVVVAAVLVIGVLTGATPGALVIVALAWLIVRFGFGRRGRPSGAAASPPPAPSTEFERLSLQWQQRLDNVESGLPADWVPPSYLAEPDPAGIYGPAPTRTTQRTPASRRRGRRTWLGTLVGLGAVWSVLAALSSAGVTVSALAWSAATLAVLGATLVWVARPARAQHGRPRFLLLATLACAAATAVNLVPPMPVLTQPSSQFVVDNEAIAGTHRLPLGDRTFDLRTTAITQDTETTVELDAGSLLVLVPAEGNVVVRGTVDFGEFTTPDGAFDGVDVAHTWSRITEPGQPTLTIDAHVRMGELEVRA